MDLIILIFAILIFASSIGFLYFIVYYYRDSKIKYISKLQVYVDEIIEGLKLKKVTIPEIGNRWNYYIPLIFSTLIFVIGFISMFFSIVDLNYKEIDLKKHVIFVEEANAVNLETLLYIVGFTIFGSFIGSTLYIIKHYLRSNLEPSQFIQVAIKSSIVVIIALVIPMYFNNQSKWLNTVCFFIGLIPYIKFKYIFEQTFLIFRKKDSVHDNIEFRYIEGINTLHRIKLKEIGIENVHNLAQYNLLLLIIRTSFPVKTIIDWVAQAQLILVLREDYLKLRDSGIRNILDLKNLFDNNTIKPNQLAEEFDLDERVISNLKINIEKNESIDFLSKFREKLGDADLLR